MLLGIRKGLTNFAVLILMGLLITSFAIFGIGDIFGIRPAVVAEVNGEEIESDALARQFQNRVAAYRGQFGPEFTTQQAIAFGVHQQVLNEIIGRELIDQYVRELGLRGTNSAALEIIQGIEAFQGPNGEFSELSYRSAISSLGMTAAEFERQIMGDVARSQLLEGFTAARIAPEAMAERLFAFRMEEREASVLSIPYSGISGIGQPDEEQLRAYYEENSSQFMSPEYRDVSIMVLDPADFAENIEISEDELRAAYEERIDFYTQPEMRDVDVVVIFEEDQAREIYDRVQAGESFAGVAAEIGGFSPEDLALGEVSMREIEADYNEVAAQRVFATPAGEITEPVQTAFGWQVFRVNEIIAGEEQTFGDVREALRAQMIAETGLDAMFNATTEIDDELAAGSSLEEIEEVTGLPVQRFERITSAGLTPEGVAAEGSETVLQYLPMAFNMGTDEEPMLREAQNDGYFVVDVNEIIEPAVRPFDEVRGEVVQAWLRAERARLAEARAETVAERIRAGEDMQGLADEFGGTVSETGTLVRSTARRAGVSPAVARLVFSLDQGEVGYTQAASGDAHVVVRVNSAVPGNAISNRGQFRVMLSQTREDMEADILEQLQIALQQDAEIRLNQELLNDMFTAEGLRLPQQRTSMPLQ